MSWPYWALVAIGALIVWLGVLEAGVKRGWDHVDKPWRDPTAPPDERDEEIL